MRTLYLYTLIIVTISVGMTVVVGANDQRQYGHPCHALASHIEEQSTSFDLYFEESQKEYYSFLGFASQNSFMDTFQMFLEFSKDAGFYFVTASDESKEGINKAGTSYKRAVWYVRRGADTCKLNYYQELGSTRAAVLIFESLN
jgi:hypothetical protein